MSEPKFRPINPLLGSRPSYGPIPADLLLPWGGIGLTLFVLGHSVFVLPMQWTMALIFWGCASWWVFTGNRPYRNLSKFIPVPRRWSRGYIRYRRLQPIAVQSAIEVQAERMD